MTEPLRPSSATEGLEGRAEQRLIGTWHLTSYKLHDGEGGTICPLGERPLGQIMYDAAGNMSCHLQNPNPPARPIHITDGIVYETRMSHERYASYHGTYEVETARCLVHHHVVGALMPGWAGTTVTRSFAFEGSDNLTLSADTGLGEQRAVLEWRRSK